MKRLLTAACLLMSFVFAGCDPKPDATSVPVNLQNQQGRFRVTSYQQFSDGERTRWIIGITDTKSGHEYLAVSGAGVQEIDRVCQSNGQTMTCVEVEQ